MGSAPYQEGGQEPAGSLAGDLPAGLAAAFAAGGEMGGRIARLDWSSTGLGAPDTWPASLTHAIAMMLASQSQIVLFWGDDHLAFYNDAYLPTIGDKHPHALGQPAREHWSELWHVLEPLLSAVRSTGQAYRRQDHPFLLNRHGYLEETYFDISYDPLRLVDGAVGGVFCIVSETTGRVIGARRLRALAELGSRMSGLKSGAGLGRQVARVLAGYPRDLPFSLLYLTDESTGGLRLAGWTGVAPDQARYLPDRDGRPPPAALARVLAGGTGYGPVPADEFVRTAPEPTGPGPAAAPVGGGGAAPVDGGDLAVGAIEALTLPITVATEPAGALVVGLNPRLALAEDYRDFLGLVATQVSTVVGNQRAYEHERARSAQLAAIDRAKTGFFANVSHEFRTPLTLVLGPIEELLGDAALLDAYREPLAVMHRNALRLLKLVNTVLDFSRLESGRIRALYQPTDLAEYTALLASTFRSAVERAGLTFQVDCPPLPAEVFVDRDMWEKIVLNLLSNALKFTFAGTISVRLTATDRAAQLVVTDTGVGMAADQLSQVFERFHRIPGARSRSHEGTGIGLALVRELAELHGGSVEVASTVGAGSTFTVTVPFGSGHLPADRLGDPAEVAAETGEAQLHLAEVAGWVDPAATAPGGVPAATWPRTGAGRVLVADDNADLRDHVTRLLSPYWQVVAVPDGLAAFAAAVESPFDLVLTDVMMPRLDGIGLVGRLRSDARTRHVPVVLLSARAGTADELAGLAAGADDYLVKPFSGAELVARVRVNVELGQLRGQIIRHLRALADAAVEVNTARSTSDVLQVVARHALRLVDAGRAVASAPGSRYEADGGGGSPEQPSDVVPLVGSSGETFGELRVWPRDGSGTDAARTALAQLGRLVGVRLENARLYEAEHRIATTLQHSLLPERLPQVSGAIVASRYLPGSTDAEVGGDWYDLVPTDDGGLVLVIGDVVGKGVPAAATMGQLRNALRAYLLEGFAPGDALTRLNRLVGLSGRRSFATVFCLAFDPPSGRLRYANAGHPPPLTIDRAGDVAFLHDEALGPPVGALPGSTYPTIQARLEPGRRLVLYTDGLIDDRRQGIDAALDRLRADAATSCDHVEDLVDVMVGRVIRQQRRDDVALLALEATELDRFTLNLPADPTRLSVLRKRLEAFLTAHQVSETDRFDLTVAVSEAAANAIEHPVEPAEPMIAIEVALVDDTVTATVRDTGRWRDERAAGAGFRGRGLALIGALGDLSVRRTMAGTEVVLRRTLSR